MPGPLESLLAAGGHSAASMSSAEPAWRAWVEHVAETLDVGPGTSVFDVGCGAGAFLYPLWENGYRVGGLDPSPVLVGHALQAMPDGRFSVGEAAALDPTEPWDVVLACGVFERFPDADSARGVLSRMVAKATHAVAVLGVPELSSGVAGRPALDRGWFLRIAAEIGIAAVQFERSRMGVEAEDRFDVLVRVP